MPVQTETSFSIIPLDTLTHSFVRFFVIPASIIGSLYMMIYDYAGYNSHSIYIVEVLCFAFAIIMFAFTEIGFLQQERYACVTIVLACLAVLVSNVSVAIITYNDDSLGELLKENYLLLAVRIFSTVIWTALIGAYYIKNRLHFYPHEKKGSAEVVSESEAWGEDETPTERRQRESWIVSRLRSNVAELDEEPDVIE